MNDAIQSLEKIESWLDKKGFVLCKSNKKTIQDEVDFERKVVFLSLRSSPINQVYSLLHECGHVIVRSRKKYKEDFRQHINAADGEGRHSIVSSVQEVEEEILAWREGEVLAKKLSINLDKDRYYVYGYKWVMGYIVMAAIGNEHLLPVVKEEEGDSTQKEKLSKIDLCKILDNATETCYYEVISPDPVKPKTV